MRTKICACAALAALCLPGMALAETRSIPAGEISAVEARDGVRIELVRGAANISIEGSRDMLDRVEVLVRDGVVRVAPRRRLGVFGEAPEGVVVRIAAPRVSRLSLANGAVLQGRDLVLGDVQVEVANGGVLSLAGSCGEGVFDAQRGGVVHAEALACASVTALASMGGVVRLQAQTAASAKASFGGLIEIFGQPGRRAVEMNFGGVVRLQPAGEKD